MVLANAENKFFPTFEHQPSDASFMGIARERSASTSLGAHGIGVDVAGSRACVLSRWSMERSRSARTDGDSVGQSAAPCRGRTNPVNGGVRRDTLHTNSPGSGLLVFVRSLAISYLPGRGRGVVLVNKPSWQGPRGRSVKSTATELPRGEGIGQHFVPLRESARNRRIAVQESTSQCRSSSESLPPEALSTEL